MSNMTNQESAQTPSPRDVVGIIKHLIHGHGFLAPAPGIKISGFRRIHAEAHTRSNAGHTHA